MDNCSVKNSTTTLTIVLVQVASFCKGRWNLVLPKIGNPMLPLEFRSII
jgi:hypothetical protein